MSLELTDVRHEVDDPVAVITLDRHDAKEGAAALVEKRGPAFDRLGPAAVATARER